MKRLLFLLLVLLLTSTNAWADGEAEWNWNDETMGKSDFSKDFGDKRWYFVRVVIENKASAFHVEQCAKCGVNVLYDGKKLAEVEWDIGADAQYKQLIPIAGNWDAKIANLKIEGYITNCGGNTGRVYIYVYASYAK